MIIFTHIKNNWKGYLIVVLLLLQIFSSKYISNLRNDIASERAGREYQESQAKVWRDKYGRSHAENKVLQLDKKGFEKLYADQLKKNFNVKAKNVTAIAHASTSNSGTALIPISANTFNYQPDKWINIKGGIGDSGLNVAWEMKDSLTFITAYRKRWFRPDIYYVEAMSHNPHVTMTGLQWVEVKEKPKRIGVGVGLALIPDVPEEGKNKPENYVKVRPAITVSYNFIRL